MSMGRGGAFGRGLARRQDVFLLVVAFQFPVDFCSFCGSIRESRAKGRSMLLSAKCAHVMWPQRVETTMAPALEDLLLHDPTRPLVVLLSAYLIIVHSENVCAGLLPVFTPVPVPLPLSFSFPRSPISVKSL